jgi:hypothetical protein
MPMLPFPPPGNNQIHPHKLYVLGMTVLATTTQTAARSATIAVPSAIFARHVVYAQVHMPTLTDRVVL